MAPWLAVPSIRWVIYDMPMRQPVWDSSHCSALQTCLLEGSSLCCAVWEGGLTGLQGQTGNPGWRAGRVNSGRTSYLNGASAPTTTMLFKHHGQDNMSGGQCEQPVMTSSISTANTGGQTQLLIQRVNRTGVNIHSFRVLSAAAAASADIATWQRRRVRELWLQRRRDGWRTAGQHGCCAACRPAVVEFNRRATPFAARFGRCVVAAGGTKRDMDAILFISTSAT